ERLLRGDELASMNFWVFSPEIFAPLAERFAAFKTAHSRNANAELALPEAINELLQAHVARIRVLEAPGPWLGVTHGEDRPAVVDGLKALVDRGDYPDPLWPS